jgi:hypothetical protein
MKKVLLGALGGVLICLIVVGIIGFPYIKEGFQNHPSKDAPPAYKNKSPKQKPTQDEKQKSDSTIPKITQQDREEAARLVISRDAGSIMDSYNGLNTTLLSVMQTQSGIFSDLSISEYKLDESSIDSNINTFNDVDSGVAKNIPQYTDLAAIISEIQQEESDLNTAIQDKNLDEFIKATDTTREEDIQTKYNNLLLAIQK